MTQNHAAMLDALALVPDSASFVAALDAEALIGTELARISLEKLADGEFGTFVRATESCAVGPQAWHFVVIGSNATSPDEQVVIASAVGLGREPALRCLLDQAMARDPQRSLELVQDDGRWVIEGNPSVRFVAVSENTVAAVGQSWTGAFDERLASAVTPTNRGSLGQALPHIDTRAPAFFATVGPGGQDVSSYRFLTGELRFTHGLEGSAILHYEDGAPTEQHATAIRQQIREFIPILSILGIPRTLAETVQVSSQGASVSLSFHATAAEVGLALDKMSELNAPEEPTQPADPPPHLGGV